MKDPGMRLPNLLKIAARLAVPAEPRTGMSVIANRLAARVRKAMIDPAVLAAWTLASGYLVDAAYEAAGLTKHDIEEMETDEEYEAFLVERVLSAYSDWEHGDKVLFDSIPRQDQVQLVEAALNQTKYGSYRGNLPKSEAIEGALDALGTPAAGGVSAEIASLRSGRGPARRR